MDRDASFTRKQVLQAGAAVGVVASLPRGRAAASELTLPTIAAATVGRQWGPWEDPGGGNSEDVWIEVGPSGLPDVWFKAYYGDDSWGLRWWQRRYDPPAEPQPPTPWQPNPYYVQNGRVVDLDRVIYPTGEFVAYGVTAANNVYRSETPDLRTSEWFVPDLDGIPTGVVVTNIWHFHRGWERQAGKLTAISAEAVGADVEVWGAAPSSNVYRTRQVGPGATLANWERVPGKLIDLDLVTNGAGTIEVYGLSPSGHVYHKAQTSPGGSWPDGWTNLLPGKFTSIAAATNQTGGIDVVCLTAAGDIYYSVQTQPGGPRQPLGQVHGRLNSIDLIRYNGVMELWGTSTSRRHFRKREILAAAN